MKTSIKLIFMFLLAAFAGRSQLINHNLNVKVNIREKSIEVEDKINIPGNYFAKSADTLFFSLNKNLNVNPNIEGCKLIQLKEKNNKSDSAFIARDYALLNLNKTAIKTLSLKYTGVIAGEILKSAEQDAKGFNESSGIISNDGIYLTGSTYWVPYLNDSLFTFDLTVSIDSSWSILSQGRREQNIKSGDKKIIRYLNEYPADEVYLIGGKWTEYNKMNGKILTQAVLRTPDSAMAYKYLNATIKYMQMYEKLIGEYPYSKFTLVENFWETGYGMPSFTLLGEKIIRFPFIINTSYPHELLHNYFGNSIYVNTKYGNWCEGLTSYLADHLIKEQDGQGMEYRRALLLKYSEFVNNENEIMVKDFVSKNNPAQEAVGYGKVSMIFEMLRVKFGDEVFNKSISDFYKNCKFKRATFKDIQKAFEENSGKKLNVFFDQWVERKGAPNIELKNVISTEKNGKYDLTFSLTQKESDPKKATVNKPFDLDIPVYIYLEGSDSVEIKKLSFSQRDQKFSFSFAKRPLKIEVDPQYNVFRKLNKDEIPITLSSILGSRNSIMVLPKASPFLPEYLELAEQWKATQQAQGNTITIAYDDSFVNSGTAPVWILGYENKFAAEISFAKDYYSALPQESVKTIERLKKEGSLVYVFNNQKKHELVDGFLAGNSKEAVKALKRKVSHYSKYSYLGFEGDKADNVLKGELPIIKSPLIFIIQYTNVATSPVSIHPKKRPALIK